MPTKRATKTKTKTSKKTSRRKRAPSMKPVFDPELGVEVCPCCMELGEHLRAEQEEQEYQEALARKEKPEAREKRERCFDYTPHPDWMEILHLFPEGMWEEKAMEALDTIVFEGEVADFLRTTVVRANRAIDAFFTIDLEGGIYWSYDGVRTLVMLPGQTYAERIAMNSAVPN